MADRKEAASDRVTAPPIFWRGPWVECFSFSLNPKKGRQRNQCDIALSFLLWVTEEILNEVALYFLHIFHLQKIKHFLNSKNSYWDSETFYQLNLIGDIVISSSMTDLDHICMLQPHLRDLVLSCQIQEVFREPVRGQLNKKAPIPEVTLAPRPSLLVDWDQLAEKVWWWYWPMVLHVRICG